MNDRRNEIPATYPRSVNGPVPLDADAALFWLPTATQEELNWYYDLLLGPRI